jgi:DNA-binding transcriptional LysR family regulator
MLDVKRLRILREVAKQGSFSAAADALSYTQSAVSQQIATLERETGTTLVDRGPRGIMLTEAGEALVTATEDIICKLGAAEAELEALAGLRGGRVRVSAFTTVAATLIPPSFARFSREHPAVQMSLIEREPDDAMPLLKAGELEIALGVAYETLPLATEGIEEVELLRDPFYLAVPPDHRLAHAPRVKLKDLGEEQWIHDDCRGVCGQASLKALQAAGVDPMIAFETNEYAVAQGLVAAGVGVALLPGLALTNLREDIVIRDLHGAAPMRRIVACLREGAYRSPAVDAMLEIMGEVAEGFRPERTPLAEVV